MNDILRIPRRVRVRPSEVRRKAKHGIDFIEAQALRSDPDRIELPARPTNEPRFLIVGQIKQAV
jgi:uncharacterized DUF497 family protein